jgi:hypothetical protein
MCVSRIFGGILGTQCCKIDAGGVSEYWNGRLRFFPMSFIFAVVFGCCTRSMSCGDVPHLGFEMGFGIAGKWGPREW